MDISAIKYEISYESVFINLLISGDADNTKDLKVYCPTFNLEVVIWLDFRGMLTFRHCRAFFIVP